jgi:hypothetical protein
MTYNQLKTILPIDSEIHYKTDCSQFFLDNNLSISDYSKYKFILFEYTIDNFSETINSLDSNNIKYKIKTDDWNLNYILINK